jgi:hypothetical protein
MTLLRLTGLAAHFPDAVQPRPEFEAVVDVRDPAGVPTAS